MGKEKRRNGTKGKINRVNENMIKGTLEKGKKNGMGKVGKGKEERNQR